MRAANESASPDTALPEGPLLVDQLRFMAEQFPLECAYRNVASGSSISFRSWERESNRCARWLRAAGVAPGDRVAIYMSSLEPLRWIVAYAAVHKAAAVAVPTNTRLAEREVSTVLTHSDVGAIILDDTTLPTALAVRPSLRSLVSILDASERPSTGIDGVHPWTEVLAEDDSEFQVARDESDLADIMYTSGTTGAPKGVAVRHRDVAMMPNSAPTWTGDTWLHGAPLFTFAGIAFVYSPMKLGLTGAYLPEFDVGRWLEIVERDRPSMIFLVPAMAELIVAHPRFLTADLSSPFIVSVGSSPLAPATLTLLRDRMPQAAVSNSYGLTEAGPAYIVMPKDEGERRPGSIGKAMPPMETRIVAPESGDEVASDAIGELQTRLPSKQREYYRDPDATSAAWTADGWLRTGDLAYADDDGFIYLVGRLKDVIIRGGNNVYATDVEAVIIEHPAVQECAVVGVPHDVLGEDVAAWVVTKPAQSLGGPDLLAFCADRLADYKRPRVVHFVDALPRNATGKVMKHLLRKAVAGT